MPLNVSVLVRLLLLENIFPTSTLLPLFLGMQLPGEEKELPCFQLVKEVCFP